MNEEDPIIPVDTIEYNIQKLEEKVKELVEDLYMFYNNIHFAKQQLVRRGCQIKP